MWIILFLQEAVVIHVETGYVRRLTNGNQSQL